MRTTNSRTSTKNDDHRTYESEVEGGDAGGSRGTCDDAKKNNRSRKLSKTARCTSRIPQNTMATQPMAKLLSERKTVVPWTGKSLFSSPRIILYHFEKTSLMLLVHHMVSISNRTSYEHLSYYRLLQQRSI